jgi:hypothetical protein
MSIASKHKNSYKYHNMFFSYHSLYLNPFISSIGSSSTMGTPMAKPRMRHQPLSLRQLDKALRFGVGLLWKETAEPWVHDGEIMGKYKSSMGFNAV